LLGTAVEDASRLFSAQPVRDLKIPFSQTRVDDFWIEYHRVMLRRCARRVDACGLAESVYRRFSDLLGWRIYDEVRPLLEQLHQRRLRLGVISNWTGDLARVLERVGLHRRFDVVIDSAHFGFEKPHAEIFAEALRLANVAPHQAMHVGDSIEHDVEGALASGLKAALLDRSDKNASFARAPRIKQLDEILALI
jgi:putative hydrolase of the HAD superfamily